MTGVRQSEIRPCKDETSGFVDGQERPNGLARLPTDRRPSYYQRSVPGRPRNPPCRRVTEL